MITHVGQLLKEEREKQDITLEQVEKATHMRLKNLLAIEEERWDEFPSRTYVQGIIKGYARYLKLDESKITAYFRREYEQLENMKFKERAVKSQFTPKRKRFIQGVIVLLILFFTAFFSYQIYLYVKPPTITIISPQTSTFKRKDKITLIGRAPKETLIKVNGKEVYLDDKEIFQTDIPLTEKKNVVIIEATGANGRESILQKTFIRK